MASIADLAQVERLATSLYSPSNTQEQQAAEKALEEFGSSPAFLAHCRFILDNSQVPAALMFASFSFIKNVTKNFSLFEVAEKIDIRNYVMQYLVSKAKADGYVPSTLAQLLCRITKLGWFDSPELKSTIDLTIKMIQSSPQYYGVGMLILGQMVQEINQPGSTRQMQRHRKIATAFREDNLLSIFQLGLTLLRQLATQAFPGSQAELTKLQEQALILLRTCLTFDFIGSNSEDAADDAGSVQAPSTWRSIIEDRSTMQLFFDCYHAFQSTTLTREVLECLVQLASIRRSLLGDLERPQYLGNLLRGSKLILTSGKGLEHVENYHELCRFIARVKSTYQLGELVAVDIYPEWIDLIAQLTVRSFRNLQWSPNSLQYLLNFWAKMISSSTYMLKTSAARPHRLEVYLPQIFKAYITARIESVEASVRSGGEEEEEEESILLELDLVANIARWNYADSVAYLLTLFDPLATAYYEMARSGNALLNESTRLQLAVTQDRLAWIVFVMSKSIGNRNPLQTLDDQDALDGELSTKIIQLVSIHDTFVSSQATKPRKDKLEVGFLLFFQHFRKAYIGDQAQKTSKVYNRMSERLGLNDQDMLLNFIMRKLATNFSTWSLNSTIIERTLDEFLVLTSGYSSLRLFAKIETVHFILRNFNGQQFPFMDLPHNFKYRTTFSGCMSKLLFANDDVDTLEERFVEFAKPIADRLEQLSTITNLVDFRNQSAQFWLISSFRDLRGIVAACERKTYPMFFDWYFPRFIPVTLRALDALYDVPEVTTAILKFFAEFVLNRNGRMNWGTSSPNGILLFRETSNLLHTIGERLLTLNVSSEKIYPNKLKAVSMCFCIFRNALNECSVNFSIFKIYGDPTFDKAMDIIVRLTLNTAINNIMTLSKLGRSFFLMLETFVPEHLFSHTTLPTDFLLYIYATLSEGLKSADISSVQQTCSILDHICAQIYKQLQAVNKPPLLSYNGPPVLHPLARFTTERPEIIRYFLSLLTHLVIFEESQIQFALSRPFLVLILLNETFYNEYIAELLARQPADKREWLSSNLQTLMASTERSLSTKNRELFAQKVSNLRRELNGQSIQVVPPLPSPFA